MNKDNCIMMHKKEQLQHGTTAEIVICVKTKNFNENDHKNIYDFVDKWMTSFFGVSMPGIAGEAKEGGLVPPVKKAG